MKRIIQRRYIKKALAQGKGLDTPPPSLRVGQLMYLQKASQWNLLELCRDFFIQKGADWHLLIYLNSSKISIPEAYVNAPWLSIISSEDVNWFGLPHPHKVRKFLSHEYHVVLNTSHQECFSLLYTLAQAYSVFKIGGEESSLTPLDFYDVVLGNSEKDEEYWSLITQCLSIIKPEI